MIDRCSELGLVSLISTMSGCCECLDWWTVTLLDDHTVCADSAEGTSYPSSNLDYNYFDVIWQGGTVLSIYKEDDILSLSLSL